MLGIGRRSGGDPNFADVVMLALNENGADTSTTFDDASSLDHAITAAGNFQWDTAQAPTGLTSSGLGDGTGDYLSTASSTDFAMSTGDFTIECFLRGAGTGQYNFSDWRISTASQVRPVLYRSTGAGGVFRFFTAGADRIVGTTVVAAGTWFHVAISRASGATKLWVQGSQEGSTYTDANDYLSCPCYMGAFAGTGGPLASLNGHMASYRVTKGVARYTDTFTPPTLPMPTS